MAAKLSNDEFAARVRQRLQHNSAKYRSRLSQSGKTQIVVWIPSDLRQQIDALTATQGKSLSVVTTELLTAALTTPAPTAPTLPVPEPVNSLPLFQSQTALEITPTSDADNRVDRNQQILALHEQGLTNVAIGKQFGLGESAIRKIVQRMKAKEITG